MKKNVTKGKVSSPKDSSKRKAPAKKTTAKKATAKKTAEQEIEPLMTSMAASTATRTRRNLSTVIERTDKFTNIEKGLVPFKTGKGGTAINIRDAITLCQKCYYNFSIFRNVIDLMTEFSVSDLYFRGGTKKSREFFEALFKKINLWDFQDKFFREYYRSGNVFVYRYEAKIRKSDIPKISRIYAASMQVEKMVVPARYVILNPADVQFEGNLSFTFGRYSKKISDYELERLRNPKTEEDVEVYESLDKESREKIKLKPYGTQLYIPLSPEKTVAVFYKRQDYEPFAVPMGYPVLEDINFKAEMKKMDMAIARTMQQAILLVTMGTEPDKGGVNQKHLEAMQELFVNQSVGRVLIADYTTKAEFVIPDIASLLDPKKYDVVNRDINAGLNNILSGGGGEKFANQQSKVEVFLARLKQARNSFLNNFLMPEIKRISKSLGMKNWPTPYFDNVSLSKNPVYSRVYTRLVELGILTPEEGLEAIEMDRLPDKSTSLDHQREFLEFKEEGLYEPIMQGGAGDEGPKGQAGRPSGTSGIPQTTKTTSPIGAKGNFSLTKVKDNLIKSQDLQTKVEGHLKASHKVKKLNETQKDIAEKITEIIIANEEPRNWIRNIKKYCNKPVDTNPKRVKIINEISSKHQVNDFLAAILFNSKL